MTVDTAIQTTVASVAGAARDQAAAQSLERTTAMVSAPSPAGDGAETALLPPLAPSPRTEMARHMALHDWQQQATQLLTRCLPQPPAARERTDVTVFFAPRPRAPEDPVQVLTPRWVQLPSDARHRLDQTAPALQVQACLDRLRSMPLSLRLTGDALAHEVPASAERLSFEL